MIDMQRFIVSLRTHTDVDILGTALTQTGRVNQGTFSAGARPIEFWIVGRETEDAETVIVAGAGLQGVNADEDINGTYSATSATTYHLNGDTTSVKIYNTGGGWLIGKNDESFDYFETQDGGGDHPWQPVWVRLDGNTPIPTFTQGTVTARRYKLDAYLWRDRYDLIDGKVPDSLYAYAISPDSKTYIIHPALTSATKLNLVWQGIKTTWLDEDELSDAWDDAAAECVAEYVKSRIVRQYDKDSVARADRHYQDYMRLRRAIYVEMREVE